MFSSVLQEPSVLTQSQRDVLCQHCAPRLNLMLTMKVDPLMQACLMTHAHAHTVPVHIKRHLHSEADEIIPHVLNLREVLHRDYSAGLSKQRYDGNKRAAVDRPHVHILSFHFFPPQNILVPDCFYSFFDLRKEFKKHFPTSDLKALNVHIMAECILSEHVTC